MDEALKEIDRQISEKEVQRLEMEASMSRLTEASETLEQTISKASEVQTAAQKKLTPIG
jgi:prefoldin subunit 5